MSRSPVRRILFSKERFRYSSRRLMSFAGTYTALVTPFRYGVFDSEAFRSLIEAQIAGGVEGIVPVGTTGESPTLTHDEHGEVIRTAVAIVRGRCKVIAGTGSNSTREALSLTTQAEKLGADAALLVAPYYNKPSQEGLFRHYRAVAEAVEIPLILYSIPSRCGIEIGVETVRRLAKDCPKIVGIKEAGGSVERVSALRQVLPDSFEILSGDDSLTLPFLSAGGVGVISVASNLIPRQVADFVRSWRTGNIQQAIDAHRNYYRLFKDLFIEPNPVPIKYALSLRGLMSAEVRLPLCEMEDFNKEKLCATLEALEIL
jgi:4-hydroxy-tetrahydrodipicolinate synthase